MPEREKVIKGLECSIGTRGCKDCDDCPYDNDFNCIGCEIVLRDAIALLKAQEPRVLTLEEANGVLNKSCLVILEIIHRGLYSVIRHGDYFTMEPSIANDYGKTFRFWSARPTDEQREAVPWNT